MGTTLRAIHRKTFETINLADLLEVVPDGVEVGDVWISAEAKKDGSLQIVVTFSKEHEKKPKDDDLV